MNVIKKTIIGALAKTSSPMTQLLLRGMGNFGKAFYQKFGQDAIPVITDTVSQGGVELARVIQKTWSVKSMKDVGEVYKMTAPIMGANMTSMETSERVFSFKTTKCPLGLEGTCKELCEAMMITDQKEIGALLGHEVEMKIPRSLAAGNDHCEIIFSMK